MHSFWPATEKTSRNLLFARPHVLSTARVKKPLAPTQLKGSVPIHLLRSVPGPQCGVRMPYRKRFETPNANLLEGMKWLLGVYTARFNRRHKVFGHLEWTT